MYPASKQIALIGVHLGKLPFYSSLYFKSAGFNPDIEFLLFTDQEPLFPLPANVRFIPISGRIFERMASQQIGRRMRLVRPRKLCDYKPAYGLIFSEYIRHTDYWGHIDFDIVWGNLGKFLQEPLAKEYDVISADGRRLSGPCTLYRNSSRLRELFLKVPHVIAKLNDAASFDIDERDFDLLVKKSDVTLQMQPFNLNQEISPEQLAVFLANDALCRKVLTSLDLTREAGGRLPALWRDGEVWSFLPSKKVDRIKLRNAMFLHLAANRVRFRIDFENDLIVPVRARLRRAESLMGIDGSMVAVKS